MVTVTVIPESSPPAPGELAMMIGKGLINRFILVLIANLSLTYLSPQ
jgi:hypothetical protein